MRGSLCDCSKSQWRHWLRWVAARVVLLTIVLTACVERLFSFSFVVFGRPFLRAFLLCYLGPVP